MDRLRFLVLGSILVAAPSAFCATPIFAAGDSSTCFVDPAIGQTYCWGSNNLGQVGNGSQSLEFDAPAAANVSSPGTKLSSGKNHSCAIIGGQLYCWGDNTEGQLGNGTSGNFSATPVVVPQTPTGTTWLDVAAGGAHTCAVNSQNTLYCWGYNASGQLGIGTMGTTPVTTPQQVASGVMTVAAGLSHTCYISIANPHHFLSCWGENINGEVGDNDANHYHLSPSQVTQFKDANGITIANAETTLIAAGNNYTCSYTAGNFYCWGDNGHDQGSPLMALRGDHGTAMNDPLRAPVYIDTLSMVQIATSKTGGHTCFIVTGGTLRCFGENDRGQLGNTRGEDPIWYPALPVPVISPATSVSTGGKHTCAYASSKTHSVYCWGDDTTGQVGNNTHLTDYFSPQPVFGY